MSHDYQTMLACLADAMLSRRFTFIAAQCAYPLPFYYEGGLAVFDSPERFEEALLNYHTAMLNDGVVRLAPRIIARGLSWHGSADIWAEWDHLDANGQCLRTSQARYVGHLPQGARYPTVEMIDYTVGAFPELTRSLPLFSPT